MKAAWQPLEKGDIIDIVAPGYPSTAKELEMGVKYLSSRGYRPRVPTDLLNPSYFHSNADEIRWEHLKKALLAKDSAAIWCLRGGYGANRLVPRLLKMKAPKKVKPLIGISDITSLHLVLNQHWHWPSLHASLLDRIAAGKLPIEIEEELWLSLEGQGQQIHFDELKPLNEGTKKLKKVKGSLIGGNLTVIQSAIGTAVSLNLKNKFLFVEDTGERGYRIDRMLEQLHQAKLLKGCLGILFGQFIGGYEPNSEISRVAEAIKRFAEDHPEIPMFTGIEAGHDVCQRILPLGTSAVLEKKKNTFELSIEIGTQLKKKTRKAK